MMGLVSKRNNFNEKRDTEFGCAVTLRTKSQYAPRS